MSVTLSVEWRDGAEEIPVCLQVEAENFWPLAAERKGLVYLNGLFPVYVDPENVREVEDEFESLREALLERSRTDEDRSNIEKKYERIRDLFRKLKASDGWRVLLG